MKKHYRIKITESLAVAVQMRILGLFWVDIKTFKTEDPEFDMLEAEELIDKLND